MTANKTESKIAAQRENPLLLFVHRKRYCTYKHTVPNLRVSNEPMTPHRGVCAW